MSLIDEKTSPSVFVPLRNFGVTEFTEMPRPNRFSRPYSKRGYAAAQIGRLTSDFAHIRTSIEAEFLRTLVIIRERARELIRNNDYAKKALTLFRVNVVGPTGFKFQSNVRELVQDEKKNWIWQSDEVANNKIEQALKDWSKRTHCSVDGMQTLRSIQDLVIQYWFRDGEAFVRLIQNPGAKYLTQLQIIEPEAVDETLNRVLPNGNVIKMGVEVDQWRRPVAYYIRKRTPQSDLWGQITYTQEYDIVPAAEMIHVYDREFVNQTRGISLLVQSMIRLHMATAYEEAALTNARVAANKIGWFYDEEGNSEEVEFDGEDAQGNKVMSAEPGEFHDIGHKRFTAFSPEYPTSQHEMFMKTLYHGTSAGLGIAYASLTNDLGDTSYASGRIGLIEERDIWKLRQQLFVESFLEPVFEKWLASAILTQQVKLPMAKLEKFTAPVWIGRRWAWVDPIKDMTAMALAREIGVETLTQQLAEMGIDLSEHLTELFEEEAEAQKLGLTTKVQRAASKQAPADVPPETPDEQSQDAVETKQKGRRLLELALRLLAEEAAAEASHNGNGKGH